MKKIYLLVFGMLSVFIGFSQVSVTATSGTLGPTAYTTLKAAFDAVNAGTHKGNIAITINGTVTETATAVLNASSSGSASYATITLKPIGGSASTVTGNIAGPLFDLNGADFVTFDGLNTGGNSLTISNTNTTATACTFRFINDATNNFVTNATVLGASTSLTSGTIFFSTGTTTGNDLNVISGCTISDAEGSFPSNAIYAAGSTTVGQENNDIWIGSNNISNFFNNALVTVGVLVGLGNTDWTITNNKFFQTAARTFTTANTHRAIQIIAGNNYSIIGNTIGYSSSNSTGTYTLTGTIATRFIAIDLAVGSTVATTVQNNTITNFSLATSSGASTVNGIWCAVNITAGNASIVGNTIGSTASTGSILAVPTSAGAAIIPINSSSIGAINISSNIIGGIDLLPTGVLSGNIQSIQATGASGNITISNNTVGNSLPDNMKVGVLGTSTGNGLVRGILNSNAGTVMISGNIIRNLTHNSSNALALFRGIECQNGTATIYANNISNLTAAGAALTASTPEGAGILATTALPGLAIDSNTISNLKVTNTTVTTGPAVLGIYLGSNVTNVSITRNRIYGLSNAGSSTSATVPSIAAGIYLRDAGIANPNILVANNMISLGNGQTTNTAFIGIWNATASANGLTIKIYYNTVNIEGAASEGAQPSFCYYRGDFSTTAFATPIVDLKNNLFTNARTGSGKYYAIANGYPNTANAGGWAANASNYNILNADAASVGYWSGDVSLANWQTASASDANSYSGVAINYVNSASDLHLTTTANTGVNGVATPIASVLLDIDNTTRNATTPDIGADEFTPTAVPITMEYFNGKKLNSGNALNWKAGCSSSSVKFDIERSNDGKKFISIGNFSATQTRCAQPFDYADNTPLPSTNYYRLKMTEADGRIYYSAIITISNKAVSFEMVRLVPTLVKSTASLSVTSSENTRLDIVVTDMNGRTMQQQNVGIIAGSNLVTIDFSKLAAGTYQVTGYTNDGNKGTIRFVKQ